MIQSIALQKSESCIGSEIIELDLPSLKHSNDDSDLSILSDSDSNQARCCLQSKCSKSNKGVSSLNLVYECLANYLFYIPLIMLCLSSLILWGIMIDEPYCSFPLNSLSLCGLLNCIFTLGLYVFAARKIKALHTQDKRRKTELLYPGLLLPMYLVTITTFLLNLKHIAGPFQNSCNASIKLLLNNSSQPRYLYEYSSTTTGILFMVTNSTITQNPYNYTLTPTVDLLPSKGTKLLQKDRRILFSNIIIVVNLICMILPFFFAIFATSVTLRTHWRSRPRLFTVSTALSRWSSVCSSSPACVGVHCVWWALSTFAWVFAVRFYRHYEILMIDNSASNTRHEVAEEHEHQVYAGRFILETGASADEGADAGSSHITINATVNAV